MLIVVRYKNKIAKFPLSIDGEQGSYTTAHQVEASYFKPQKIKKNNKNKIHVVVI